MDAACTLQAIHLAHRRLRMEIRDHASIDVTELADSIRWKFNLYPLSRERCIYRVPQTERCLNPSNYTPKMVSIGPLHHGREGLQVMEEHKIRYLRHFLGRTKVRMEDFLASIKNREAKLRNCYAETIPLESDDFVRIILVDAIFLIELCLRGKEKSFRTDDDLIFGNPVMISYLWLDLWLVENQLPFFILDELFDLAKTATNGNDYGGLSLITISHCLWDYILAYVPLENNSVENHFSEAVHLLDWLRLCLRPSHKSSTKTEFKIENIPSAKELHQAGVKIQLESSKTLLDIKFEKKGILKVPNLRVYDSTEPLFQNILNFERMRGCDHYFNDYILLMSYLISTAKDAELLIEKGIIGHRSGNELSAIFKNLNKNCRRHGRFQYSNVVKHLQDHCERPYNNWKAILKQNYFHNPWASISVIAAATLLLLTLVQTICSVIAL